MLQLMFVFGTRPEAIKLAPLIINARNRSGIDVVICNTGQHREMTSEVLELFDLNVGIDLDIMVDRQTLSSMTSRIITLLGQHLD